MGEAIQSRYYQQASEGETWAQAFFNNNKWFIQANGSHKGHFLYSLHSLSPLKPTAVVWMVFFYFISRLKCVVFFPLVAFHCSSCSPWCRTNTPTASTSAQSWTHWSFMYKHNLKARWGKSGGCTWCCLDVVNRNASLCSALLSG